MDVRFGFPKYMPTPYSVYVSNFGEAVLAKLKDEHTKPFARYHKADRDYEITREVYDKIKSLEPVNELNSLADRHIPEPFHYHDTPEYQYQEDAVEFSKGRDFLLLNFSQGCGKTRTSLRIVEERGSKKILIITGVSNLQEEWLKDAKKHHAKDGRTFADYFNMRIVAEDPGAPVKKRVQYLQEAHANEDHFADLIGIESLRNVPLTEALDALHYDAIIIDEVQAAKGMKAEQTQGVHDLHYFDGQLRLALSGTPVLNDPLEYYSVLRFLKVLYYNSSVDQCSRSAFNKYYGVWGFDYFGHYVCTGYQHLDELKELLQPVLVYVPKSVLGLPPKHRETIELPVSDQRYPALTSIYKQGAKKVKNYGYKTLQQVAADLQVVTSSDQSKIDFILQKIKEGTRPLVFSQYTTVLDIVKDKLEAEGYSVGYYHGQLNSKQRLAVLDTWKAGNGDALLLSISAARYGLNLQETQVAIFLEPPTSPAILAQAEDRLHRIGQTKEVYSYCLLGGESDYSDWNNLVRKDDLIF